MSCQEFVAQNPGQFSDMYWEFQSLKIYQSVVPSNLAEFPLRAQDYL